MSGIPGLLCRILCADNQLLITASAIVHMCNIGFRQQCFLAVHIYDAVFFSGIALENIARHFLDSVRQSDGYDFIHRKGDRIHIQFKVTGGRELYRSDVILGKSALLDPPDSFRQRHIGQGISCKCLPSYQEHTFRKCNLRQSLPIKCHSKDQEVSSFRLFA